MHKKVAHYEKLFVFINQARHPEPSQGGSGCTKDAARRSLHVARLMKNFAGSGSKRGQLQTMQMGALLCGAPLR